MGFLNVFGAVKKLLWFCVIGKNSKCEIIRILNSVKTGRKSIKNILTSCVWIVAQRIGKLDLWCLFTHKFSGDLRTWRQQLGDLGLASLQSSFLYGHRMAVPAPGIVSASEAGGRKGRRPVSAVSVSSLRNMKTLPKGPSRFLFRSLWPELCSVAAPGYKGAWESEYFTSQSLEKRWEYLLG